MANVVFASNSITHFQGANANVSNFDATRVPYSIHVEDTRVWPGPVFEPVVGDISWLHYRCYNTISRFNAECSVIRLYDTLGAIIFKMDKRGNSTSYNAYLYDGVTSVTTVVNIGTNLLVDYDFKVTVSTLVTSISGYYNGVNFLNLSIPSGGNIGKPAQIWLGGGGSGSGNFFSEIYMADEDTRNSRLSMLRPTAAGAYSDWDGALSTISDDDLLTGLTTILPAQRQSMAVQPYQGSVNISNVIAVSTTSRGQNSPANLNHFIRMSTVDYDGAVIPIPFDYQTKLTDWKINPATSLPWKDVDIAAIEVGFQSLA